MWFKNKLGMKSKKIIISGTGCALGDFLYNGISFDSPGFKRFISDKTGDGGLSPGKLVFTEELEEFSGCSYSEIIKSIVGERLPDSFNVGGPSLVSLIHASQMLDNEEYEVKYFGTAGADDIALKIFDIVRKAPLNIDNYLTNKSKISPFTDVFSDPGYDNGHGERTFVNNIGAAWDYKPGQLTDDFFNSEIVCFGGTALVPQIHDNLLLLLSRAKSNNCLTIVNTVFDFRNEKKFPGKPWPLGSSSLSYSLIDILITDCEEALKISGQKTVEKAADFFTSSEVSSFIITNGANNIYFWSGGRLFRKTDITQLPVSKRVTDILKSNSKSRGDTTGCGDNFAGGVIASLAWQIKTRIKGQFDMIDAISWGVASGGFTCFIVGGTYLEKKRGEKLLKVKELQQEYLKQTALLEDTARQKKMVIFGAGKIGRSFIGQLFSRGGYEVVFIDIYKPLIDELNLRRNYNIIVKSEIEEIVKIGNVRGVHADDEKKVIYELSTADIIAVSVGLSGLDKIFPLLAKGILERHNVDPDWPIDIIIAENMRNADILFKSELMKLLPESYPVEKLVGLIETSIGKMVPIMQRKDIQKDILQIFAEPYNTLILNKKGFRNPIPDIIGLAPKENMKAWVDRKLFIHNLGHSAAAYIGYIYNPEFIFLYEALAIPEVHEKVKAAMQQSAVILLKMYPEEFTSQALNEHISDLLLRFQNRALGDTIYRVGCDLMRKLGSEDRLAGAIRAAIEFNLPYENILYALVCGCHFRAVDEDKKMLREDLDFVNRFQDDIISILKNVCGFNETTHKHLFLESEVMDKRLRNL
jgi:mannitol-1-phosphate 5-dehydrogenase